jgi:N-acetylglucosamine kinase-like BadF-type ATPase
VSTLAVCRYRMPMETPSVSNWQYLLGIDSGGTKSQLVIWKRAQLEQTPRGLFGEQQLLALALYNERFQGINLDVIDEYTASQRLFGMLESAANALRLPTEAFLQQTKIVMGLAGLDTPADEERAKLWFRSVLFQFGLLNCDFTLLPDVELALWAASPSGVGVVLIAGTGSNCFGMDAAGNRAKTGGMSHFLSDEGGGFMLGWEALHVLTKMHDGRIPQTELYDALLEAYAASSFAALKTLIVGATDYKHLVGQAGPVVQRFAKEGEQSCVEIVQRAVADLRRMAETVVSQLDPSPDLSVYLVGSLFRDDFYRQLLISQLYSEGIRSQPMRIEAPVVGVVSWQVYTHQAP